MVLLRRETDELVVGPRGSLSENPAAVYLAALAPGSRPTARGSLDTIARLLGDFDALSAPWHALRRQHMQAIRQQLADGYAPNTANKMLSILKSVLREAALLDLMPMADYEKCSKVKGVRHTAIDKGRALSADELHQLLSSCGDSTLGLRDAALIAVLGGAGLRRAEAVALNIGDLDLDQGRLLVRKGKGSKERWAYLAPGGAEILRRWLDRLGRSEGPLLVGVDKAGRARPDRLRDSPVLLILRRRAALAGVAPFAPHDLRRTFVSALLDAGASLSTAQQLAGHANVATTAKYDKRGERAKREAAALLPDLTC